MGLRALYLVVGAVSVLQPEAVGGLPWGKKARAKKERQRLDKLRNIQKEKEYLAEQDKYVKRLEKPRDRGVFGRKRLKFVEYKGHAEDGRPYVLNNGQDFYGKEVNDMYWRKGVRPCCMWDDFPYWNREKWRRGVRTWTEKEVSKARPLCSCDSRQCGGTAFACPPPLLYKESAGSIPDYYKNMPCCRPGDDPRHCSLYCPKDHMDLYGPVSEEQLTADAVAEMAAHDAVHGRYSRMAMDWADGDDEETEEEDDDAGQIHFLDWKNGQHVRRSYVMNPPTRINTDPIYGLGPEGELVATFIGEHPVVPGFSGPVDLSKDSPGHRYLEAARRALERDAPKIALHKVKSGYMQLTPEQVRELEEKVKANESGSQGNLLASSTESLTREEAFNLGKHGVSGGHFDEAKQAVLLEIVMDLKHEVEDAHALLKQAEADKSKLATANVVAQRLILVHKKMEAAKANLDLHESQEEGLKRQIGEQKKRLAYLKKKAEEEEALEAERDEEVSKLEELMGRMQKMQEQLTGAALKKESEALRAKVEAQQEKLNETEVRTMTDGHGLSDEEAREAWEKEAKAVQKLQLALETLHNQIVKESTAMKALSVQAAQLGTRNALATDAVLGTVAKTL